jgi:elongator complex protein 3
MMLGLPGSTKEMDLHSLKQIFEHPDFRPDMLKIYPCLVIKGSQLYKDWRAGNYLPVDEAYASEIIREFKKTVPEWVRIMRIERDIPGTEIEAGIKSTNLRQLLGKTSCRCIRCREVGHVLQKGGTVDETSIHLHKIEYVASRGKEFFLQFTDSNNILIGFLRLRLCDRAIVRELHVYGEQILIGKKGAWQHRGYGKKLLQEAEEIAKQNSYKKLYVISGIGAKEYYKKLGYKKSGAYVVKILGR